MPRPPLLTPEELTTALATLPGWTLEGATIQATFRFPSYLDGIAFVQRLAHEAEALNHHPDLLVQWRKVQVTLSTHNPAGLTALDIELAQKCVALAG